MHPMAGGTPIADSGPISRKPVLFPTTQSHFPQPDPPRPQVEATRQRGGCPCSPCMLSGGATQTQLSEHAEDVFSHPQGRRPHKPKKKQGLARTGRAPEDGDVT